MAFCLRKGSKTKARLETFRVEKKIDFHGVTKKAAFDKKPFAVNGAFVKLSDEFFELSGNDARIFFNF